MKYLWACRRTFMAMIGIVCLMSLAYMKDLDVVWGIVSICGMIAGANAVEKFGKPPVKLQERKDV